MASDENVSPTLMQKISHFFKRLQFGNKAQLAFLEDFYVLLSDGIPANRAIEMMAQVTTGISHEVALSIGHKISQGQLLADGMQDWFDVNIVEIIRVGEEGGVIVETLKSAINTLTQHSGALSSLIGSITYPLLVIVLACAIIVYLDSSVFVQFKEIKPLDQWPQAGRDLLLYAEIIRGWWWLLILFVMGVVLALRYVMANYVGELRPLLDKFPPFSLYRRFAASRFLETLGLLVANGVVFKHALKVMQYQANPYITSHLVMMDHLLGMGKGNIADVLQTGLVSEGDILRLRVVAEVKGFEHGLIRMGLRGSVQNIKVINIIAKTSGGVLLVFGAFLIVKIVQGIYLTGMSMGTGNGM